MEQGAPGADGRGEVKRKRLVVNLAPQVGAGHTKG
jgi:hypothetical protein